MINTATGVKIPFPNQIDQKYATHEHGITLNISIKKLKPFIDDVLMCLSEPLFLFLHVPLNEKEEREYRLKDSDPFHDEILYLDGQTKDQVNEILAQFGELLIHDGISQFGIASHQTGDEIFIQKYKIVDIYSQDPGKYFPFMDKYDIAETDKLITAWDTFSPDHPGECTSVMIDNKDIYSLVESLKEKGMYRYKIVEA